MEGPNSIDIENGLPGPDHEKLNRAMGEAIASIPLRSIHFDAKVRGLQSQVVCQQRFANTADKPVEAVYVFPLPDEASIIAVTMKIGSRKIFAELKEKKQAREEYETARDRGQHASLLEQERPNIFTMSVAGIEPKEEIEAFVEYSAPVPWQAEGGRFIIPTVVAPRFIHGQPLKREPVGAGWSPDTDAVPDASKITPKIASEVPYKVSLSIELTPGFAAKIECPSHDYIDAEAEVSDLETRRIIAEALKPDRDVVITYRTERQMPSASVDLTKFKSKEGDQEKFVMVQITAGKGQTPKHPLDVVLCLDRSGSMAGAKIEGLRQISRRLQKTLARNERPTRIGVVIFDDRIEKLVDLSLIERNHFEAVEKITAGGNTYIGKALTLCMEMLKGADESHERCIIALSDGQSMDKEYNAVPGVRIHTIGIDTAANYDLLKQLAKETGGQAEFVLPGEDYTAVANRMAALASGPVVRNIQVKGTRRPDEEVNGVSDLFANKPATICVRFAKIAEDFKITGTGTDGKSYEWDIRIPDRETTKLAEKVWVKEKLRKTDDEKKKTGLSLRYGVLGPTTAFVAVSEKAKPGEKPVRVEVPVLLPHTWEFSTAFVGSISCRRMTAFRGGGVHSLSGGPLLTRSGPCLGLSFFSGREAPPIGSQEEHFDADVGAGEFCHLVAPEETLDADTPGTTIVPPLLLTAERLLAMVESKAPKKELQKKWAEFKAELESATTAEFWKSDAWSELNKARLYQILATLAEHGYKVTIPDELEKQPKDADAYRCWQSGRKILKK
jgi:Ca-activated chloride channel family protein